MPKVKPLGTQKDSRAIEFNELIGAGMMRKNIQNRSQLAKAVGISYETMNDRLRYPWSFKLDEMLRITDVLDIPAEEITKIFKKGG